MIISVQESDSREEETTVFFLWRLIEAALDGIHVFKCSFFILIETILILCLDSSNSCIIAAVPQTESGKSPIAYLMFISTTGI